MAEEIPGRTVDSGVTQLFEREALTWVFDAQCHEATGTDEGNLNIVVRVEMPAMFHRVEENFSEGGDYGFPIGFRNAGVFNSAKELDQAILPSQSSSGLPS
jgi:hypothetical protein